MNKEFKKFTLMDETPSAPASDKTIMIDDFEKLAIKLWKESDDRTGNPPYIYSLGVEHGYNNAKESLYTEEQVKQAINRAIMLTLSDKSCYSDEIIKSLKK
jgi:hypothetical protein